METDQLSVALQTAELLLVSKFSPSSEISCGHPCLNYFQKPMTTPDVELSRIQSRDRLTCYVSAGLSNRINCLVSGFLIQPKLHVVWSIWRACPASYEEVFLPMEDVTWEHVYERKFKLSRRKRHFCWPLLVNEAQLDPSEFVERARERYRYVLAHLRHQPSFTLPFNTVGISFRARFPHRQADKLNSFLPKMTAWLNRKKPEAVFVASDSSDAKSRLLAEIETLKFPAFSIECPLMQKDLDRSPENVFGMAKELICFGQCHSGILVNNLRSTIPDSARGYGIEIERTFESGGSRRDPIIENWMAG
jgi:hypothetical protein